ncbi:MAG TPA: hypothetical protein VIM42_03945 [Clostridium sp.]
MQKQQPFSLKNHNQLLDLIKKVATQTTNNIGIAKHYYCTVTKVYSDLYADCFLQQGSASTTFSHMVNKSGVILNINDLVLLTAPMGDLSDMYIDKNQNTNISINASNVVGTLTVGGDNNTGGIIEIISGDGTTVAMDIEGYAITLYDYLQSGLEIGSIITDRDIISGNPTGAPSLAMIAEQGCSIKFGLRNVGTDGTYYDAVVINNNAYNSCQNIDFNLPTNFYPGGVSGTGLEITPTSTNVFGNTHHEGYDSTGIGTLGCVNLQISGTKSCVQDTNNFGKRLFYAMEYGDNQLGEHGFGNIINGECVVSIDPIVLDSINTDMEYTVRYDFDEDCVHKLTKTPLYFILTANKDIGFSWSIMGFRKGFENENLEYADNIQNDLMQPNERNVLINDLTNQSLDLSSDSLLEI